MTTPTPKRPGAWWRRSQVVTLTYELFESSLPCLPCLPHLVLLALVTNPPQANRSSTVHSTALGPCFRHQACTTGWTSNQSSETSHHRSHTGASHVAACMQPPARRPEAPLVGLCGADALGTASCSRPSNSGAGGAGGRVLAKRTRGGRWGEGHFGFVGKGSAKGREEHAGEEMVHFGDEHSSEMQVVWDEMP